MSSKTDVNIAPPATPTKKRKLRLFVIFTCLALAGVVTGLLIYLNSGSFRETCPAASDYGIAANDRRQGGS